MSIGGRGRFFPSDQPGTRAGLIASIHSRPNSRSKAEFIIVVGALLNFRIRPILTPRGERFAARDYRCRACGTVAASAVGLMLSPKKVRSALRIRIT
jgi:hypothetical protein